MPRSYVGDPQILVDADANLGDVTFRGWETNTIRINRRIPSLGVPPPHEEKGVVALYDKSDDWIPIYDRTDLDGYYVAVGTSGNQFTNAGVAGHMMAEPDVGVGSSASEYASPEQLRREAVGPAADVYGQAVPAYQSLTAELPSADTPDPAGLLHRQLTESIPRISERRIDVPAALDAVLQTATAQRAHARYQSVDEFVGAFRDAATPAERAQQRSSRVPISRIALEVENLYKGLRPFGEGDAGDYFGRDRLIDELVIRLRQPGVAGARPYPARSGTWTGAP